MRKGKDPCVKLNNAWQKYGEDNFEYSVICYCIPAELNSLEMYYINMYNSCKNGYNCTLGGDGITGFKHTDETREIIRQTSTGRKHTEETRALMSMVQTGRYVSEAHKQALRDAWTPERKKKFIESRSGANNPNYGRCGKDSIRGCAVICNTGEVFPTLVKAAEWCGLTSIGNLSSCINGKRKYCGRHPVTGEQLSWRKATDAESSIFAA